MKALKYILIGIIAWTFVSCSGENDRFIVKSPSKDLSVMFFLNHKGELSYSAKYKEQDVILNSKLGFEFKNFENLSGGFELIQEDDISFEEEWEMPWGEKRTVVNKYGELKIHLKRTSDNFLLNIICRAYDDGFAFRYEFPEQGAVKEIIITDENTEFNLTGDHTCWWIPGDWDIYEHLYKTTKFSEINALKYKNPPIAQSYIPYNAVNTPVTMKITEGLYLSFHEANLTDYAGMTLRKTAKKYQFISELVGNDDSIKVTRKLPFKTPWRTVQVAEKAGDLIESDLIVNLNEPNKLGDVDWFKPTKYVGIWWDMHLNIKTWDLASGNHGATTKYAKELIDFAAENNIGGILVEGWNTGWEHWIGFEDREGVFDFVTPYPDYNLEEVVAYGKSKSVDLIMHHETSAAPRTYEEQLDTAYVLMNALGIHSVKTGYVGQIIPDGEYHHGQWMVNHYRKVLTTAAKYDIAINAHEPIKATGLRRTYPNAISREGLRGQEFNAWSVDGGNPPEHLSIVAFTRMLAGPIDFTPGIFHISLDPYKPDNQINTTLAHQLALYVVVYSPIQMVPDLIQYYKGNPAFQFIKDVGVDWEEFKVLDGEIGDFVCIARKEKETENWFIGGITDENEREISISLDFLETGKKYKAIIYKDGNTAHYKNNPTDILIEDFVLDSAEILKLKMAEGGGFAISLFPVE